MSVRWIGSAPGASETVRRTDHSAMINAECVDWDRLSGAALFGTPMRRAPAAWRCHLRQEPGAVIPLAGICGGGYEQSSVPTPTRVAPAPAPHLRRVGEGHCWSCDGTVLGRMITG
jgi:hypothetical protein